MLLHLQLVTSRYESMGRETNNQNGSSLRKIWIFPQWVTVLICIKVDWLVYLFTTHANVVWTFKLLQLFLQTFHEQQIGFNVSCNLPANNPIYCYFAARSCQVHICSMANHMWIKKGMFPLVNKFVRCKLAAALPLSNKYNSRIRVLVQNYFVYTSIKCSGDKPDLEVKYCEVKIIFSALEYIVLRRWQLNSTNLSFIYSAWSTKDNTLINSMTTTVIINTSLPLLDLLC